MKIEVEYFLIIGLGLCLVLLAFFTGNRLNENSNRIDAIEQSMKQESAQEIVQGMIYESETGIYSFIRVEQLEALYELLEAE